MEIVSEPDIRSVGGFTRLDIRSRPAVHQRKPAITFAHFKLYCAP